MRPADEAIVKPLGEAFSLGSPTFSAIDGAGRDGGAAVLEGAFCGFSGDSGANKFGSPLHARHGYGSTFTKGGNKLSQVFS